MGFNLGLLGTSLILFPEPSTISLKKVHFQQHINYETASKVYILLN